MMWPVLISPVSECRGDIRLHFSTNWPFRLKMTEKKRHRGGKWERFKVEESERGERGRECGSLINDHTECIYFSVVGLLWWMCWVFLKVTAAQTANSAVIQLSLMKLGAQEATAQLCLWHKWQFPVFVRERECVWVWGRGGVRGELGLRLGCWGVGGGRSTHPANSISTRFFRPTNFI